MIRFNKPGMSDIVGVGPYGTFIAVECKRLPNRLKDGSNQADFLEKIALMGGFATCVYDVEQLQKEWKEFFNANT